MGLAVIEPKEVQGIGWAVKQMHAGNKVAREFWNGKGMYIFLINEWTYTNGKNDNMVNKQFVAMKTVHDTVVPWLCSQTDLLGTDWIMVE